MTIRLLRILVFILLLHNAAKAQTIVPPVITGTSKN